jgi:uncharacterized protein YjlB
LIKYTIMTAEQFIIETNGLFPNNAILPVLLYRGVLPETNKRGPKYVQDLFEKNNWGNTWVNGIYTYHHYHSNTHEVLGIICGQCTVMLGGDNGKACELNEGDVLILPAGVAHMNIGSSENFTCVGGYPDGKEYDINYGRPEEHPGVDEAIIQVPIPDRDPVAGNEGILFDYWHNRINRQ